MKSLLSLDRVVPGQQIAQRLGASDVGAAIMPIEEGFHSVRILRRNVGDNHPRADDTLELGEQSIDGEVIKVVNDVDDHGTVKRLANEPEIKGAHLDQGGAGFCGPARSVSQERKVGIESDIEPASQGGPYPSAAADIEKAFVGSELERAFDALCRAPVGGNPRIVKQAPPDRGGLQKSCDGHGEPSVRQDAFQSVRTVRLAHLVPD